MMAVSVSGNGQEFTAGKPKALFDGDYLIPFDVARNGEFLMIKPELQPITQINFVQNWIEELRQRVR
jgi:hypothetical protein